MVRRARWLATATMAGAALVMATPAAAGGSWLETEERYYSPGDQAAASATFGSGQLNGRVADGPYYAHLVPGYRWFPKPGPVPDYAIPLGPIAITPATGNYCCWKAALTFKVPELSPGRYSIDYCNDPCTVDGVGDLVGGSFWIAASEEQARLLSRIERLEAKAEGLQRVKQKLRKVEGKLLAAQEDRANLLGRLRAAAVEEASAPEGARETTPRSRSSPWLPAAGMVLVLLVAAWYRLRLAPNRIPDRVPEELVKEVLEDQVPSRQPMTSRGRPPMSIPAPPLTKS
jgi:hypothetical protein